MTHLDVSPVVRASVWILPGGEALERILEARREARRRAGGPEIRPHVTLLGGIETTQADAEIKLKRLAGMASTYYRLSDRVLDIPRVVPRVRWSASH